MKGVTQAFKSLYPILHPVSPTEALPSKEELEKVKLLSTSDRVHSSSHPFGCVKIMEPLFVAQFKAARAKQTDLVPMEIRLTEVKKVFTLSFRSHLYFISYCVSPPSFSSSVIRLH